MPITNASPAFIGSPLFFCVLEYLLWLRTSALFVPCFLPPCPFPPPVLRAVFITMRASPDGKGIACLTTPPWGFMLPVYPGCLRLRRSFPTVILPFHAATHDIFPLRGWSTASESNADNGDTKPVYCRCTSGAWSWRRESDAHLRSTNPLYCLCTTPACAVAE